jgi:hypothetical protein
MPQPIKPSEVHLNSDIRLTMRALLATHESTRRLFRATPETEAYAEGFRDAFLRRLPRPPVQTVQTVTTSHEDRAKGFTLTTVPLAAVVGLVALLAAAGLAGVPWLSWSALLILFGVFAAVWAGAYFWHTLASPRRRYDPVHLAVLSLCQTRATRPP